jgi:hypothetical protein
MIAPAAASVLVFLFDVWLFSGDPSANGGGFGGFHRFLFAGINWRFRPVNPASASKNHVVFS